VRRVQWARRGNSGRPPASFSPYVATREIQMRRLAERGEVGWHTHALVRGWIPLNHAEMTAITDRYGLGQMNVRARKIGDLGDFSAARYLTKSLGSYLSKNYRADLYETVMRHLPAGQRLMVHSPEWAPGVTLTGLRAQSVAQMKRRLALAGHDDVCDCRAGETHLAEAGGVDGIVMRLLFEAGLLYAEYVPPPDEQPPWVQDSVIDVDEVAGAWSR
jgi:hypothetical protein